MRSAVDKVMWVGRGTVFLVGLATILVLTFVPKVAVASAHINNDSTVGTGLGNAVPTNCPTGFKDAAARTYASNSLPSSEANFRIMII